MSFLRWIIFLFCSIFQEGMALTIPVVKGVIATIPLAFPGFEGDGEGEEMAKVITNDLKNSGIFEVLKDRGSQSPREAFIQPTISDWKNSGDGAALLSGIISRDGPCLVVTFRMYDIASGRKLTELRIRGLSSQWRVIAHKVSNKVYERLTGEAGCFDTQIVYTAQFGAPTKKTRLIAMIDQDGENCQFLTSMGRMALTPRCCPTSRKIAYSAFHGYKIMTHVLDLVTGRDTAFSTENISISPRFSNDGQNLLFCLAKNGTASIYLFNLVNRGLQRLTSYAGKIDVSPSCSPDGRQLVFASDRKQEGRPKLYIMSSGGGEARCISNGSGSYHCPVWSPDGAWIAFIRTYQGQFYLGVMTPEGTQERMIASDHVIDHPSRSPNSRMLVFAAQERNFGPFSLYIVDLTGRTLRKLLTMKDGKTHEGNHPDWSPHPYVLEPY